MGDCVENMGDILDWVGEGWIRDGRKDLGFINRGS